MQLGASSPKAGGAECPPLRPRLATRRNSEEVVSVVDVPARTEGIGGIKTQLIVSIELPALEMCQILHFPMRPADAEQRGTAHRLLDVVQELTQELRDSIMVDTCGTAAILETLRARARQGLEDWRSRLKLAEEGLIKVGVAKKTMNTMRENYYKELMQLREQVHRREQADKAGKPFEPDDFCIFDPTDYCFGDEDDEVLKMKAMVLQQRFDNLKQRWVERLEDMAEKVRTKTMLAERKDMLLQAMMAQHGYKSEGHLVQLLQLQEREAAMLEAQARGHSAAPSPELVNTCTPPASEVDPQHGPSSPVFEASSAEDGEGPAMSVGGGSGGAGGGRGKSIVRSITRKLGGGVLSTLTRSLTGSLTRKRTTHWACPSCGSAMPDDTRPCKECGFCARDTQHADQACDCGATFTLDSRLCDACGAERSPPGQALEAAKQRVFLRRKDSRRMGERGGRLFAIVRGVLDKQRGKQDHGTQSDLAGLDVERALACLQEQSGGASCSGSGRGDAARPGWRPRAATTSLEIDAEGNRKVQFAGALPSSPGAQSAQPRGQQRSLPRRAGSRSRDGAAPLAAAAETVPEKASESEGGHSSTAGPMAEARPAAATRSYTSECAADGVAEILMRHGVPINCVEPPMEDDASPRRCTKSSGAAPSLRGSFRMAGLPAALVAHRAGDGAAKGEFGRRSSDSDISFVDTRPVMPLTPLAVGSGCKGVATPRAKITITAVVEDSSELEHSNTSKWQRATSSTPKAIDPKMMQVQRRLSAGSIGSANSKASSLVSFSAAPTRTQA